VAEIAERVGYESLPAFSKAIKRRTGGSPFILAKAPAAAVSDWRR